jgi:L-lysine exporter family protein LysE/ArgO
MTTHITTFLAGFGLSAALILASGAQNLFVLRQGLRQEHVGAIVFFCGCADAVLILAGVAGVGAFLAALPGLQLFLGLGGAAFLGWYGVKAFQRMLAPDAMRVTEGAGVTLGKAIAATAAFTFLNPHVYVDTVLLMGAAGSAQPVDLRPVFVLGATSASFAWFTALGYGARLLVPLFSRPEAWRVLDAFVGITMLTLAGSLLVRAATT